MGSFKDDLEKDLRTVKTRDYVLSDRELERFRILGVYNSTSLLGDDSAKIDVESTSCVIAESRGYLSPMANEPMERTSAIIFADKHSMMAFVASKEEWFKGSQMYQELYN